MKIWDSVYICSWFSVCSHRSLSLRSQMSRLRKFTRQILIYLRSLSLGIITFYRTLDKKCCLYFLYQMLSGWRKGVIHCKVALQRADLTNLLFILLSNGNGAIKVSKIWFNRLLSPVMMYNL